MFPNQVMDGFQNNKYANERPHVMTTSGLKDMPDADQITEDIIDQIGAIQIDQEAVVNSVINALKEQGLLNPSIDEDDLIQKILGQIPKDEIDMDLITQTVIEQIKEAGLGCDCEGINKETIIKEVIKELQDQGLLHDCVCEPIDEEALITRIIAKLQEQGLLHEELDKEVLITEIIAKLTEDGLVGGDAVDEQAIVTSVIAKLEEQGLLVDADTLTQQVIDKLTADGIIGKEPEPIDEEALIQKILNQIEVPTINEAELIGKVIDSLREQGLIGDGVGDGSVDEAYLTNKVIDSLRDQGLLLDEEEVIQKVLDAVKADASLGCDCDEAATIQAAVNKIKYMLEMGYQPILDSEIEYGMLLQTNTIAQIASFDESRNSNLELGEDGYLVLHANKTYYLSGGYHITNSGSAGATAIYSNIWNMDTDTNILSDDASVNYLEGDLFQYTITGAAGESSIHNNIVFTPEVDTRISIKKTGTSVSSGTFYLTVFELKQPVVTNVDTISFVHSTEEHPEDTPVGHIMAYMGNTVPEHYLTCDGSIYNIADYPYLSQHINDEFGSPDHFGGNKEEGTFAVPDLRGEFLRGSGQATAYAELSNGGAAVGGHQIPTQVMNMNYTDHNGNLNIPYGAGGDYVLGGDAGTYPSPHGRYIGVGYYSGGAVATHISVRPTNTAVLYCIKYEPTYYLKIAGADLSEEDMAKIEQSAVDKVEEICTPVKEKYDQISQYQKFINTELEYGYYTMGVYNATTNSYATTMVLSDIVPFDVELYGNIPLNEDHTVTLHAGKTYRIAFDMCGSQDGANDSHYAIYNVTTEMWVSISNDPVGVAYGGTWNTMSAGECIYTALQDEKVCLKYVDKIKFSGTIKNIRLIVQEIARPIVADPLGFSESEESMEDSPVGEIISYMGITPPKHYLNCDGTEYPIGSYPYLEQHFISAFGSVNHFGGDGTTTFAVPDLRGEFLRGTGTPGAEVGEHQDATLHSNVQDNGNSSCITLPAVDFSAEGSRKADAVFHNKGLIWSNVDGSYTSGNDLGNRDYYYTSRPTNTSIMWCIKCEPTYFMHVGDIKKMSLEDKNEIVASASDLAAEKCKDEIRKGYQKVLDDSVEVGVAIVTEAATGDVIGLEKIIHYKNKTGNIELDENGYVILHAGKKYMVMTETCVLDAVGTTAAWMGCNLINAITGEDIVDYRVSWSTTNLVNEGDYGIPIVMEPEEDIHISAIIKQFGPGFNKYISYLQVTEIKQPVKAPQEIYSTDEIPIGIWIDGKPLYQKIITMHKEDFSNYDPAILNVHPHNIADVDNIFISGDSYVHYVSDDLDMNFPIAVKNSVSGWYFGISKENTIVNFDGTIERNAFDVYLIAKYTKTTD